MQKGFFIVFEGADGSGKSTQIGKLADYIREKNKYKEVFLTREPTANANEIIRKLVSDNDSFKGGDFFTDAFILDRRNHFNYLINPLLEKGVDVLCDRYSMSTCAYQQTQGVDLKSILKKHDGIPAPDLTFYLDVSLESSLDRIYSRRQGNEKFEKEEFIGKLIANYRKLAVSKDKLTRKVLGKVVMIDGNSRVERVSAYVRHAFDNVCK